MQVYNAEAILLSDNTLVSQSTNHIDVRHHFIREYIGYRIVKIKKNRSEENLAYQFTNNLSNGPFQLLTSRNVHCEEIFENSPSLIQSREGKALHLI